MAYTRKQKRIAQHIFSVGRRSGASRKELLAALETALVEANLQNPRGGTGTSAGWRQEISSYGSVGRRRNVRGAARRFFQETRAAGPGRYRTAGQLAQAVQRSAYPYKYDQRRGQASDILHWLERTKGRGAGPMGFSGRLPGSVDASLRTIPGVNREQDRKALMLQYLQERNRPDALLDLAKGLSDAADTPAQQMFALKRVPGQRFSGQLPGGNGRAQTNIERIIRYAKKMGLHPSENALVGGVGGGHVAGTYHRHATRFGPNTGAVDISGDPRKMAALAHYLSNRYGRDLEELIYSGPGSRRRDYIKRGKRVGPGFYRRNLAGHRTHVHVADVDD